MDDIALLEQVERPVSPEKEIDSILGVAADYLAGRVASAYQPDSKEDLKMRLAGARLQQKLVRFFFKHYNPKTPTQERDSRTKILAGFNHFWKGYHQLVLKPLQQRGYKLEDLPKGTGIQMVSTLANGVRGMIAATFMARACGWKVDLPSTEDDVKLGKDLILKRGGQEVALQVKCHYGGEFLVRKDPVAKTALVVIPANPEFYRDPELGVPHNSKLAPFGEWLNSQLGVPK